MVLSMKKFVVNFGTRVIFLLTFIPIVSVLVSCNSPTVPVSTAPSKWVVFSSDYHFTQNGTALEEGVFHTNLWKGHRIYSVNPLRYYDFDDSFKLIHDSVLLFDNTNTSPIIAGILSMSFNPDKTQLLTVKYNRNNSGGLQLIDLASLLITQLLDTSNNISTARYLSDDSILYYSYGSYSPSNVNPSDAGYYLYVRSKNSKQLLLRHISDLGPRELRNGFDIHPDHSRLLIPSGGYNRSPIVFEFNFTTKKQDTLPVTFTVNDSRWCLFLRYNHDGSKILYSSYPPSSFGQTAYEDSEVGIIDRVSLLKTVLDTDPYEPKISAICLFPEWSPDENSIVYGSNSISRDGRLSTTFRPTILKSIY